MKLQAKTIFISGGASGLGAACAQLMIENGARVVIADLNHEAGSALAHTLGEQALYIATNVTDESSVQRALDEACAHFTQLDGVINCAGIGLAEKVLDRDGHPSPLEHFQRVININLIGTFNVIRLASGQMSKNQPDPENGERGVIINTASIAAFDGQIGQAAYSASKGGIVGLTLPIARELARYGIRVMTIAPGIFDTPLMNGLPAAARQTLEQQVPFPHRLGRPAEYAALAHHIFENEMLNGEVIRLDGALRLG
jgi:Dehydrogenases with different specificities (related to short-chain alcohol dehydrogenases)